MKKLITSVFVVCSFVSSWGALSNNTPTTPEVLGSATGYYSQAEGKEDAALFAAMSAISRGVTYTHKKLTYDDIWKAFKTTDIYPAGHEKEGLIWDMYSTCSYTLQTDEQHNVSSSPSECSEGYNREHSLPKNWWGNKGDEYKQNLQGCDIGHIVPTDYYVNGIRSNFAFGEVKTATYTFSISKHGTSVSTISISEPTISGTSSSGASGKTVFEPADEYKGDFARIYMYMRARYDTLNLGQGGGGGSIHFTSTTTAKKDSKYGLTDYSIILLMKWHRQDPVSQKEIDRNNSMERVQGNRNPFIDYPIIAEYLWGNKAGQVFHLKDAIGSFESAFIPGESDGERKIPNYQIQWKVEEDVISSELLDEGTQPTPPSVPECTSNRVFMGWTANNTIDKNVAPSDLFEKNAPLAVQDVVYYAVFADKGIQQEELTFTPGTDIGTSSVSKSTVTCQLSNTSRSDYYQIYKSFKGTFSSTGRNIKKIEFTCTTNGTDKYGPGNVTANVGSYIYQGNIGIWTGDANTVELSAGEQVRMNTLTVTIGTDEIVYSNYSLECIPKYTVSFINDDAPYAEITNYSGTEIKNMEDPTMCKACTFVGWSTHQYNAENSALPTIDFEPVIPEMDITYYAVYECTKKSKTPIKTNDYKKITSVDELTNGNYLVVSPKGNYVAMSTSWKNTYYLAPEIVKVKEDLISNPQSFTIWQIIVDKEQGVLTFRNVPAGALSIVKSNTYYNIQLGDSEVNNKFSYKVEDGKWIFTSTTYTDRQLEYYLDKEYWSYYTAQDGPIYLFKQQEGYSAVYYVSHFDCEDFPMSINETHVNTFDAIKVHRNGQIFILCGEKMYTITGQEVK